MEDGILIKLAQEYGIINQRESGYPSTSFPNNLPLDVSFDLGYHLLVKAIQELRRTKGSIVTVGIGGPSGSGKTSLARKVASVLGSAILSLEDYQSGIDLASELESIDFNTLKGNLTDLLKGTTTSIPIFDFKEKRRAGERILVGSSFGVVIVDGIFALHSSLKHLLDFRVAVVGGVHFSLLSKVNNDIGAMRSLESLVDSIFPLFRKYIEPDLNRAQIRINNSFVSSFREPIYKLKCKSEASDPSRALFGGTNVRSEEYIEMFLRSPSASEDVQISDWIKVRQCGTRYYLSLGDQRLVHKNFILRPKAEFEVGKTTLGGLLQLDYKVIISYIRKSASVYIGQVCVSLESIDDIGEIFLVLKGPSRKVVEAEASALGIRGPWVTKSYLDMIIESQGIPAFLTPPPMSPVSVHGEDSEFVGPTLDPLPKQIPKLLVEETCSEHETKTSVSIPINRPQFSVHDTAAAYSPFNLHMTGLPLEATSNLSSLNPTKRSTQESKIYNFDEGLLVSILKIQTLLDKRGAPVIVGIGGPSGSGKTSMARKMANIVGCEVISLESYYIPEKVKDFMYDNVESLDTSLLLKNIKDIRNKRVTKVPMFDFEKRSRNGFRELNVAEDSGVVIFDGIHALHPHICSSLNLSIVVVGGGHSHLIERIIRDRRKAGSFTSREEIISSVFSMFQKNIEPHLPAADIKIQNDFDPVLSPESSLFVLKSHKKVSRHDVLKVLDPEKIHISLQNFADIYLLPPGIPFSQQLSESEFIRVRMCEGRFALLIREPIREGDYILQPKVNFDISTATVSGLLKLGYQAVAYISASATIYRDDKVLIEVDNFEDVPSPFLQIKGFNKEAVLEAATALQLDGQFTTKSFLQVILDSNAVRGKTLVGIDGDPGAKLQNLLQRIQSQEYRRRNSSETLSVDFMIEDLQLRVRRLERWHTVNTVLWTFFMSALIGYSLYQRKRH